jgi:hypothetical protein
MTTETERAKQLAEDHWNGYVSPLICNHAKEDHLYSHEDMLRLCKFHYLTASVHFFGHGVEAERKGEFRPRIGDPLPPEEVERISGKVAPLPLLCKTCGQEDCSTNRMNECEKYAQCARWIEKPASSLRERIAEAKEPQALDLVQHLHRQRAFSLKTFGPGNRTKGVIDHITKELKEIEADPSDLYEWVDLVLLALDGAWRAGHPPEAIANAISDKQTRNEARKWPDWRTADPDKAIEHDRSGEAI